MPEREASLGSQRNGGMRVFPVGVANAGRHVGDGMKDGALTQSPIVTSHMSARSAAATLTLVPSASCKVPPVDRWAHRPRYARDLVWADNEPPRVTLAAWTESALPLSSPPANELSNEVALKTIRENPHLFKIVTPIDVDRLEHLLNSHPNRPLVHSICQGFRDGFWPWAITDGVERPLIVDNSFRPISDKSHINFIHEQ